MGGEVLGFGAAVKLSVRAWGAGFMEVEGFGLVSVVRGLVEGGLDVGVNASRRALGTGLFCPGGGPTFVVMCFRSGGFNKGFIPCPSLRRLLPRFGLNGIDAS